MNDSEKENETPSQSPPIQGTGGENGKRSLNKGELVSIAFELGFIIALPVVIFGLLGKWLDGKTGTDPLLTIIGIFTAMIFTTIWMYRKFKVYFEQMKGDSTPSQSPPSHGGERDEDEPTEDQRDEK